MKINLINNVYNLNRNNRSFLRNLSCERKDEIDRQYKLIADALKPYSEQDIVTIEEILKETNGAIGRKELFSRLNSSRGKKELWPLFKIYDPSKPIAPWVATHNIEKEFLIENDFNLLLKAADELCANPHIQPTRDELANFSGLKVARIEKLLSMENKTKQKILISKLKEAERKHSEYLKTISSSTNSSKKQNYIKARRMIKEAIKAGERISYQRLSASCNLSHKEIDDLILQMAEEREAAIKLEHETKERIRNWTPKQD